MERWRKRVVRAKILEHLSTLTAMVSVQPPFCLFVCRRTRQESKKMAGLSQRAEPTRAWTTLLPPPDLLSESPTSRHLFQRHSLDTKMKNEKIYRHYSQKVETLRRWVELWHEIRCRFVPHDWFGDQFRAFTASHPKTTVISSSMPVSLSEDQRYGKWMNEIEITWMEGYSSF